MSSVSYSKSRARSLAISTSPVNNAGVGVFKPLVDLELARFKAVFDTNVTGAMLMGREAAQGFSSEEIEATSSISPRLRLCSGAANAAAYYGASSRSAA